MGSKAISSSKNMVQTEPSISSLCGHFQGFDHAVSCFWMHAGQEKEKKEEDEEEKEEEEEEEEEE